MKIHFGYLTSLLMAILISISSAGTISSQVFVTGRLTVNAAKRGYLPSILKELGVSGLSWEKLRIALRLDSDPQGRYRPMQIDEIEPGRESGQREVETLPTGVPMYEFPLIISFTRRIHSAN